jgi:hypothetical protein
MPFSWTAFGHAAIIAVLAVVAVASALALLPRHSHEPEILLARTLLGR